MSSKRVFIAAAAVIALVSIRGQAWGQASGPITGNTLWHFLGIPQGFNKVYDDGVNRNGNRPGLERRGPVRSITDPSNLDPNTAAGQNPAIAKAAEIKQQEDLKKQKIKAIKYLATIGCCCYKGVDEALMAAMDDCTEEVRYEAVKAVSEAGKEKKKHHGLCHLHKDGKGASGGCNGDGCDGNCCCSEEMSKKLAELAYEKNDKCCWLEPSERVREAAKEALRNCCPGNGPPGTPEIIPRPEDIETRPRPPVVPETVPSTRPETRGVPTPPPMPTPLPPGIPTPPPPLKNPNTTRAPRPNAPLAQQSRPRPIPPANDEPGPDCRFEQNFNPRLDRVEDSRVAMATHQPARVNPLPTSFSAQVLVKDDERLWEDTPVEPTGAESELGPVNMVGAAGGKRSGAPDELHIDRFADSMADNSTADSESQAARRPTVVQVANSLRPERPNGESAMNQPRFENESRQLVHGRIVALDARNRIATLSFPRGYEPPVGAIVKVNHTFLLGPALIGELRVIELKEGAVIAQPTSNLSFGKMSRDDEVESWTPASGMGHPGPSLPE